MSATACRQCATPFPPGTNTRRKFCAPCMTLRRSARTMATRKRNQANITGGEGWHGTTNGYMNHRCRCANCRTAYNVYHDEWRRRPEVAERRREQAKIAARAPHRLLQKRAYNYGITVDELASLLDRGACDSCGSPCGPDDLNVDHDHACCAGSRACGNCVRGVLCRRCNLALGAAGDDAIRLRLLADYIEARPTK